MNAKLRREKEELGKELKEVETELQGLQTELDAIPKYHQLYSLGLRRRRWRKTLKGYKEWPVNLKVTIRTS